MFNTDNSAAIFDTASCKPCIFFMILTSVHVTSVDATKIVQTLLEVTSVSATLVMKLNMITEPVLVKN